MAVERCDECGYDADDWSDSSSVTTIEGLPAGWFKALAGPEPAPVTSVFGHLPLTGACSWLEPG